VFTDRKIVSLHPDVGVLFQQEVTCSEYLESTYLRQAGLMASNIPDVDSIGIN